MEFLTKDASLSWALTTIAVTYPLTLSALNTTWVAICGLSTGLGILAWSVFCFGTPSSSAALNLSLSVGMAVKFCARMSYAYIRASGSTMERLRECYHSHTLPMFQTAGSVFVGAVSFALATRGSVKGPFSLELNAVAVVIAALHALAVVPVFMCTFMPASRPPVRGAMERKIPLPGGYSTYKLKPSLDPNPRKFGGIPLHGMVSLHEVRPLGRGRPCAGAGVRRGFQRLDVVSDLGTSLSSSSEAEPDLTAPRPNPRCLRKTDGDVFFKEREHYVQSRIQCHACSVPRHLKPHFPFLSSAETWLPKR